MMKARTAATGPVAGNFYTNVLVKSPYFHIQSRIAYPDMLAPFVLTKVQAIVADAADAGIKLIIFETYRSQERQGLLFTEGTTQLKTVGTHHYGLAADLVVLDSSGMPTWNVDYSFMGDLARKHGMVWGGPGENNLNIGDLDHVQLILVSDQDKLFAGEWYPPDDYTPFAASATPPIIEEAENSKVRYDAPDKEEEHTE